jgi:hypothetical protein
MPVIRTSHSAIRKLISCPRKILFSDEMRLFPVNGSIAMRYGSGFHKAMEAYYSNNKDVSKGIQAAAEYWNKPTKQIFHDDYRNLESLIASLITYDEQYRNDKEEVIGFPENKIVTRILLTDEEKSCYGDIEIDFVVVIDLVLGIDGMTWIVDFKTTSVDLPYMGSRLRKMPQLMGYQFGPSSVIKNVAGTMIYYHQLKATKSRTTGLYGATKTDFMKFPMIFSENDYYNWRKYIIWEAYCSKVAKDAGYPPNYNSCYEFNKSCEYLPLCDYPKWDIERFLSMDGFVVIEREEEKEVEAE